SRGIVVGLMISSFVLVLAAIVSIFLGQLFTKVSVSYISMLIGGIIAFTPFISGQINSFNSEIFIGLVVAPLLFFEGQATRLNLVGKEIKHVIQTAVKIGRASCRERE